MCTSPSTLLDGTVIACRNCPQCRDLRIADWQGRNIAEAKTATKSFAVTLTYGRVNNEVLHSHAVALFYSDVQKYLKLLRRHDYSVRYFVTGEFGGLKGRSHWHIVQHFYGAVPPHVLDENFDEQHWPHGFSFWTEAHARTVQYNCKYIMKDLDDAEAQGHLAMSKKPPIGAEYFAERAREAARQGTHLRNLDYSFPDVRFRKGDRAGQRKPFRLTGKSALLYIEEYIAEWRKVQLTQVPKTELLAEHSYDPEAKPGQRVTRLGWMSELRRIRERREDRPAVYGPMEVLKLQRDDDRVREILREHREVPEWVQPPPREPVDMEKEIRLMHWRNRREDELEALGYWTYRDKRNVPQVGGRNYYGPVDWEAFDEQERQRREGRKSEPDGGSAAVTPGEAGERSEFYEGKQYGRHVYGAGAKPKRAG